MNALHFGPRRTPSSRILGHFLNPKSRPSFVTDHAPVHVRDNMIERDIILTRKSGCELRGAINRDFQIVASVYTHFDPNGEGLDFHGLFYGRAKFCCKTAQFYETPCERLIEQNT